MKKILKRLMMAFTITLVISLITQAATTQQPVNTSSTTSKEQKKMTESEWVAKKTRQAEQGDVEAMAQLGRHYLGTWMGVVNVYDKTGDNDDKAIYWLKKAAEQGDADSQWLLGTCYEKGRGVSRNFYEAAKWYKKAADQGHRFAKDDYREMKLRGYGVD